MKFFQQDLLANEKSAMINEAYHTLRDEYRRARYDREHQSAGKWEGTYGQFTYNYFKRDAGYEQFACNYLKRYATYIWKFVVKGGKMVAIFANSITVSPTYMKFISFIWQNIY